MIPSSSALGLATLDTTAFPSWAINNVCAHPARLPACLPACHFGVDGKKMERRSFHSPSFFPRRSREFHVNIGMERRRSAAVGSLTSCPILPTYSLSGEERRKSKGGRGRRKGERESGSEEEAASYLNNVKRAALHARPGSLAHSLIPLLSFVKAAAATFFTLVENLKRGLIGGQWPLYTNGEWSKDLKVSNSLHPRGQVHKLKY